MRALVTGANGFIGSHLVEHLHDCGKTPVAMVRESSNLRHVEGSPAELRYATLREPDSLAAAMEGCDAVFHVAGLTAAFSEQTLQDVNAQGTANVLAAAQRAGEP